MMEIQYDDNITHCPFCFKDDACVRLAVAHAPDSRRRYKVCPYHGVITGKVFYESAVTSRPQDPR